MPSAAYGPWELVALIGAVHGLFLAAVLWSQPRGGRVANRLLAALLLLYSVQLLHIVLFWTGQLEDEATRWLSYYFVDSWAGIEDNPRVDRRVIEGAHVFVWLDAPDAVRAAIRAFAASLEGEDVPGTQ